MTNWNTMPETPEFGVHETHNSASGNNLTVYNDGTVDVHGINFDSKLTVHSISKTTIVVKASGGKHWVGRGMDWGYHSPSFMVYKIKGEPTSYGKFGTSFDVEGVLTFEVGRETTQVPADLLVRNEDAQAVQ